MAGTRFDSDVAGTGGTPTILIIDDSPEVTRMLAATLRDKARILFATEPEAGIRLAVRERPQLILLDVEMPKINGYEVCLRLKHEPATRDCAVLIVTGHSDSEHEVRALEAGAVDFIGKPLNPAVVRARVQTHLSLCEKNELLLKLACNDGLTGIFNRRHFDEQLAEELRRHQRHGQSLGLALIDVDHFKAYNDGYGHLAGDDCLRRVAQAIHASSRRPGETAARYGGEEFAVIVPTLNEANGQSYGQWICDQVSALGLAHAFSSAANIVTVSVGVATLVPSAQIGPADLIGLADRALYRAKQNGRNRCEFIAWRGQDGTNGSR